MAAVTDALVPLGPDAGFQPSRDVDRVVAAGYGAGDVAAVVQGRFDEAKIAQATKAKNGTAIAKGTYAGQTTYAVGNASYAVLTSKTLVAGTTDGVRRVLERIQAGTLTRAMPPWVVETLETKGAEMAVAADFATQPIASAAIGSVSLPWLKGMRVARVIGNLEQPGLNVAATLTYADPTQAQSAADGVRSVDGWLKVLGPLFGGLKLQDLKVKTDGGDMQCSFAVDDHTLSGLISLAPRFLPSPPTTP
jgi:hypothetical protein